MQRRDAPHEAVEARRPEATIFRQPSSLTDSSGAQSIVEPNGSGVTYAQVVFPPDKRKPDDGSTSPKRLAVPANVPLHHLSETDVRAQLGTLKSFNPAKPAAAEPQLAAGRDVAGNADMFAQPQLASSQTTAPAEAAHPDVRAQSPVARPQSPETDF